jgi:hypothetical protein
MPVYFQAVAALLLTLSKQSSFLNSIIFILPNFSVFWCGLPSYCWCIINATNRLFSKKKWLQNWFKLLMDYYNYLKSLHLIFVITLQVYFILYACFWYQIEVVQNHRQKEILHIKANDLPPWYVITWPSAILKYFCIGCCFYWPR